MDCRYYLLALTESLRTIWIALLLMWPARFVCRSQGHQGCRDPGVPANGYRRGDRFDVGYTVTFGCSEGFVLSGSGNLTCVYVALSSGAVRWDGEPPRCVLPLLRSEHDKGSTTSCSKAPRPPAFAKLVRQVPGSLLEYRCWQGYKRAVERLTLRCIEKTWQGPVSQCRHRLLKRAGRCTDYGSISNGLRILQSGTDEGDTVVFRCNTGYILLGNRELTCNGDGTWSGPWPICAKDSPVCPDPGTPQFGSRLVEGTSVRSQVNYSCANGFALIGSPQQTCLQSGEWSGPPPTCVIVNCGIPPTPKCGSTEYDETGHGSTALYRCNRGYVMEGLAETTCSDDGTWNNGPPTCKAVQCEEPEHPKHGRVSYSRPTMYMTVATYSCNQGYGLEGPMTRICQANSLWSQRQPACRRGICSALENPENGWVQYSSTEVGSVATYTCLYGYRMSGARERACLQTGWSGSEPSCNPSWCSPLTVPTNGAVSLSNSNLVFSEAMHTCNVGYRLLGVEMRVCQPSGIWSDSPPGCYLIRCLRLRSPHRGRVSFSNGLLYRSEATYTCDPGYELKFGDRIRTCMESKLWSGTEPCCVPIMMFCEELSGIPNGRVTANSRETGAVATYSCNRGYVLEGSSERVCGGTGVWSGEEPTCILVTCNELTNPVFGVVNATGDGVGDRATYFCQSGYLLSGDGERVCQENGEWSGSDPTCQPVDCGVLASPPNGAVNFTTTTLGSTAVYSCDPSLTLRGPDTRICQENGQWSGIDPFCEDAPMDMCVVLNSPSNGDIVLSNGTATNSQAQYMCDRGYVLVGNNTRVCGPDGWSGEEPMCVVIKCRSLEDPEFGTIIFESPDQELGSEAMYVCDSGYVLEGEPVRTCLDTGDWSGEAPTCEAIDCGPLGNPDNGMVSVAMTTMGSVANYTCNDGYSLVGPAERTCQANGLWSDTDPTCEVDCGALVSPLNGAVNYTTTTLGSTAVYSCDPAFSLRGGDTRVCQDNGLWNGTIPSCEEIRCLPLPNPPNGMVSIEDSVVGSRAFYFCDPGYALEGDEIRVCRVVGDGTADWSGEEPVCKRVTCPELDDPANGSVIPSSGPPYFVNTVVLYTCERGFRSQGGSIRRVCGLDGTWGDTAPECVVIPNFCPDLEPPDFGSVMLLGRSLGSQAVYNCSATHILMGEDTRTCQEDETWSGEAPTCERLMCPTLDPPINGNVDVSSQEALVGIATYTCISGFVVIGPVRRLCLSTGEWAGDTPVCDPTGDTIACPRLTAPENGFIEIFTTTPTSRVTYTCFLGYVLQGDNERVCQSDGTWTGSEPSCEAVNCGPLADPDNGMVMISRNTTLGMMATYTCNPGYELTGLSVGFRFCTMSGNWSETDPTCESVDCGPLSPPLNGIVNLEEGTLFMSRAFYTCLPGYDLVPLSAQFRTCTDSGMWSGMEPTCELAVGTIDCGSLDDPVNGQVMLLNMSTSETSLAEYSCQPGYRLVGGATRQCQGNGVWDGNPPQCIVRECPPLPPLENGMVLVSERVVNSTAFYICNPGYINVGFVRRVCEENGTWSGEDPACVLTQEVACPSLAPPTNGNTTVTGPPTAVGSEVTYTCNPGFVLEGPPARTCQANGVWTGQEPTCERPRCPDPGAPANGRRIGDSFMVDDIVFFICNDGFAIEGQILLRCLEDGTWNSPTPVCIATSSRSRRDTCSGLDEVIDGFGRKCACISNQLRSCCRYRREWSQLSPSERLRYINAVKTAATNPKYQTLYNRITELYLESFDTVVLNTRWETSQFFPWHRYFLHLYEDLLRVIDKSVTIPYWDWTVYPSEPYRSLVFDPVLGFGDSSDNVTDCVSSGPFREGEFNMTPSAGGGCIRRRYRDFPFYNRQLFNNILSIQADSFDEFHQTMQLFVHLNARCFLRGTMCSNHAANDPLYLLLLARLDLVLDRWQAQDEERATVRYANDTTPLAQTLGEPHLRVSDYSNNGNLPYGTAVCYSALPPIPTFLEPTE